MKKETVLVLVRYFFTFQVQILTTKKAGGLGGITMDIIILIGSIIFGIGILIYVLNTKVRYGFFTHYQSRNKGLAWISALLIIIGLGIIIVKAYLNGQLG